MLTNEDLHTLTGAYAVNALPLEERGGFEEHLARCEPCAIEVRGLIETAARLAAAVSKAPPPALRGRVRAQISRVRQQPAGGSDRPTTTPIVLTRLA